MCLYYASLNYENVLVIFYHENTLLFLALSGFTLYITAWFQVLNINSPIKVALEILQKSKRRFSPISSGLASHYFVDNGFTMH